MRFEEVRPKECLGFLIDGISGQGWYCTIHGKLGNNYDLLQQHLGWKTMYYCHCEVPIPPKKTYEGFMVLAPNGICSECEAGEHELCHKIKTKLAKELNQ